MLKLLTLSKKESLNYSPARYILYNPPFCRNDNFLGVTSKFSLFSHVTLHKYRSLFSLFSMYMFVPHSVLNTTHFKPIQTNQLKKYRGVL